jgi:hypothetical protein
MARGDAALNDRKSRVSAPAAAGLTGSGRQAHALKVRPPAAEHRTAKEDTWHSRTGSASSWPPRRSLRRSDWARDGSWERIRRIALTDPARAGERLDRADGAVKVPVFIQGGIHGNEYEGVDAAMQLIERLATTPAGADAEVDAILDHAVVVFNPIEGAAATPLPPSTSPSPPMPGRARARGRAPAADAGGAEAAGSRPPRRRAPRRAAGAGRAALRG